MKTFWNNSSFFRAKPATGILRAIILIGIYLLISTTVFGQQGDDQEDIVPTQSTVFLIQTYEESGLQILSCIGSGTVVSDDGLILTNFHLVAPVGPCKGDKILVALSVRPDEPPVPAYIAQVVQSSEQYDLAVLRITAGLDGSDIDTTGLNLPFVQLGDPTTVLPGTSLIFSGFPESGSSSPVSVIGPVTGLTTEKAGTRLAWLRTTTSLGGVMAGGGAFNSSGQLVGILTSASGTDGITPGPACINIQDSNLDGLISETDACVPVGGAVTMIRPVNFALPLIEAAQNNFSYETAPGIPESPVTGQPTFRRLFFSPQVTESGLPSEIVSSLPSGSTSAYFFFDYDNLQVGTPYEIRVTSNGVVVPALSVGPLSWGGSKQGSWYVGTGGTLLTDGSYEFTIFANGQAVASAQLTVGGQQPQAAFSNLRFFVTAGTTTQGEQRVLFPAETVQISAQFAYAGMSAGQDWTEAWYLDGLEIFRTTRLWDQPSNGLLSVSATNLSGLPLGKYRLELSVGQRLAATGDITLAGNAGAQGLPAVFSNPRVVTARTRDDLPAGQSGDVLPLGTTTLITFVDWDFMPSGVSWTYRWYLDGKLIADETQVWNAGGVGQNYWISLSSNSALPEGTYAVEMLVEGSPMFSKTVSIGSGTRPISGLASGSEAVAISGTVIDSLTGVGVSDASVYVLNVKLTSATFNWNEGDIFSKAVSDQRGRFTLSKPLPKGNYYTVYIFAEGYITMVEDFFTILSTQTSPVDIEVRLNRP